jgi:hypothetical protein
LLCNIIVKNINCGAPNEAANMAAMHARAEGVVFIDEVAS